jgi:hypothetical protein
MRRLPPSGHRSFAALLLVTALTAACGDGSPSTPPVAVVATVGVEPATADLLTTATLQLTATPKDAAGAPITGRTIAWHSENQSVATVTPVGNVSAIAPGTARITATVDGKVGASVITVSQPPVGSVTVTPANHTLGVGGSVQLTAAVRDVNGGTLNNRTVTWTSADAGIASVDGNGLVRGVAAGSAVITAASEGVTGTAQILVSASAAVVIGSVSPARIQEGQSATITGTGFSPEAGLNEVRIGNVAATVVSATATSLTVTVPPADCLPARDVAVSVTVSGLRDERLHPWRPASFLDVPVGQQLVLAGGKVACLQFDASTSGATYLIGVQSVSGTPTALTDIQMRASTPGSVSGNPALDAAWLDAGHAAVAPHSHDIGTPMPPMSASAQRLRAHREAELKFRLEERQQLQRQLSGARRLDRQYPAASTAAAAVPGSVQVGDSVQVKYPSRLNSCFNSKPLSTVVRYRGTRSIWLEDVANPAGGFSEAQYAQLGTMFDNDIYDANEEYFGEPTDLDGNGRIVVVITREINTERTVLGRVYFADLFPEDCPGANGGEFFYGIAPDPDSLAGGMRLSTQEALREYPVIVAHELAHVIQVGRRTRAAGSLPIQTIWELEGQATLAEEVVGHRVTGRQPGQNYGFSVAWNEPALRPESWYINPFIDLVLYYGYESQQSTIPGAPEQCGWMGIAENGSMGPCIGGRSLYGVTWSFLRWISDHYGPTFPGGEQGLHRAMVMDSRSGFATLSALTGRPIEEMLAQWSAMLYLDDRQAGLDPKLTLPSWDFHGGTGTVPGPGLTGIWSRLIQNAQLRPRQRSFSAFLETASVRAGSTAYFRVSGTTRPATALSVRAGNGALPLDAQVWVVRLQ